MPGFKQSFFSFIQAFRSHWLAAMSGGFSVPFTGLAIFAGDKYQQIIFGCLAFAAFWFAAYRIWKHEYDKTAAVTEELERLRAISPDLKPQIDGLIFGGRDQHYPENVPIILIVSISNLGTMQNIANEFQMTLERDGVSMPAQLMAINPAITIGMPIPQQPGIERPMKFGQDQALYNKTASPIAVGSMVTGILLSLAPSRDWASPDTKITLAFKDIKGRAYQTERVISARNDSPQEFGGLHGEFI
jgi:hypothetical protein